MPFSLLTPAGHHDRALSVHGTSTRSIPRVALPAQSLVIRHPQPNITPGLYVAPFGEENEGDIMAAQSNTAQGKCTTHRRPRAVPRPCAG
jgi:hypothetical protein